jgi:serine-type D-Ala-D-Ala carboxypeptidase/endopeptidase (penicillin-binding protein 4)
MHSFTRTRVVIAVAAVASMTITSSAASPAGRTSSLDPRITAIMSKPLYKYGQWGLLEINPRTGRILHARYAKQFFIPGSTAKLFSVSAAWHTLGGNHRFHTPVYAVGHRHGHTVRGNLVLVAKGDLTMGGRTKPNGNVAYTYIDHTYANDVPGATLTPENPLAGINKIARQVRHAGIRTVRGNVVVDNRLFSSFPELDPSPTPMIINDNVIDVRTTPTRAGKPAKLFWRPKVAPYRVISKVRTVRRGGPTNIAVHASPDGTHIAVSGTIAAHAAPVLRISNIEHPAAFARTALIQALHRVGVSVAARRTGPDPARLLPRNYRGDRRVAVYVSPRYWQYARLILKVSHNLGANLDICLMAVASGRHNCAGGFRPFTRFLRHAGVSTKQVQLLDGRGGNPVDRTTPTAEAQMLEYWLHTKDAARFRRALPILGVDGSLAKVCRHCPARGKVFAKVGTVTGFDAINNRLAVGAETIAGYLKVGPHRYNVFFDGVNGASSPSIEGVIGILDDTARIAAILQQNAAAHRD